ncbi:Thiol-disulfide oxidoreductase ResA [Stieleria maiorica]|uniref:Thiol-disulfide oxidoreductase ResA n=1 Tax=Stieleria maiorica TaxID=2795974 RepID=A0A5B9MJL3_9BACT|nr:redoxin domain-containing protein [Stieleria maiorica]QEF99795.1 Thiol-disulfide oxidoreductase ResA [Stieleria maiorica]
MYLGNDRVSVFGCLATAFFVGIFWTCGVHGQRPLPLRQLTFRGTDGEPVSVGDATLTAVCFLGTECPLAKLYGPRLQRLADRYADRGVTFLGVNSNLQDSPAEIDAYAKKYVLEFPMIKDADQSIADAFEATRTPEVFLVDSGGMIVYQGRIDDQYEPGISRAHPTTNDLRDAIEASLTGAPIDQPKTTGVGCLITRATKMNGTATSSADVTFNADIAAILNEHCVECHRPGEIAPMALTDYDEVVGWGQMILEVIDQKRMPPWHADPDIGHFVGQRRMSDEARNKIAAWIDDGMPQGDAADRPPLPQWPSGWQFASEPDVEIAIRDRPFTVPAEGVVEYQYFVVDPKWTEDRWIRAAQVIPGDASVVHHAIVFVRPPDGSSFHGIGWMAAYVPGQRAVALPDGHARLVPAGSKLVFQMHYTPNGHQTEDLTRVGVWTVDREDVTHEVFTRMAIDHEFEIPPGVENHVVKMAVDSFPPNSRMLGITPHMHLRGKSFLLLANRPGGQTEPLLRVPHYDFNWQHWYEFAKPVNLSDVDSLEMSVSFDNSTGNPFNPAPDDFVSWGDQTWEEMAVAFFDVAIPRGGPHYRVQPTVSLSPRERQQREQRMEEHVTAFLDQMDVNADGIVERDETPVTFQRFGFNRIDQNRDGRIERDEISAAAAERL